MPLLLEFYIYWVFLFISSQTISKSELWTHFYIDQNLPGSSWGTGGPSIADFDNDGDLDMFITRRSTMSGYWYEYVSDDQWIRHYVGKSNELGDALGSTVADVNGDGYLDVITLKTIFINPGDLNSNKNSEWEVKTFNGGGHDMLTMDLFNDGTQKIIIYDGGDLVYYNANQLNLKPIVIGNGKKGHGAIAPKGYGDLDNDGFIDLVLAGYWFKNPGNDSTEWTRYTWPFIDVENASYGTSIRTWVADINNDGENDIIYSNCDTGSSLAYIVLNKGKGKKWVYHKLPIPDRAENEVQGTGSFHSLCVADFDLDGHLDIFIGEQEDPDTYMVKKGLLPMKSKGLKERGIVFINNGAKRKPVFFPEVIHSGNPGWHDTQTADIDGDGDMDMVTKIWNKDGISYTASFWRNNAITK